MPTQTKYILVTGGVISGIGKGIFASSTGLILKTAGYNVTAIKIDPYINVDAGTMAPTEHGEVYVLDDGGECDLDLGNYERYLGVTLSRDNNITTGRIYQKVIERERRGDYLGKTVQTIPHITDAIIEHIENQTKISVDENGEPPEICVIELGGTVGDIEGMAFVEAMRQLQVRVGRDNFVSAHVSLVPSIGGELKTKPTQASVREVRSLGLQPDLIACRGEEPLPWRLREKIGMFCNVSPEQVVAVPNVSSVYHVPANLRDQGLVDYYRKRLNLPELSDDRKANGEKIRLSWKRLTDTLERPGRPSVKIALVGKYTSLIDSYTSVVKALEHSAAHCDRDLEISWIESTNLESDVKQSNPEAYYEAWGNLTKSQGILVPGGFGHRGTEGMMAASEWARESKVPFLGICLGFQVSVVAWARSKLGLKDAQSAELVPDTKEPIVIFMPEIDPHNLGGTMRCGLRATVFDNESESWSRIRKLYAEKPVIWERHRHRYEINPAYVSRIEESGLHFIGKDEKGQRMQVFELQDHPYYVGMQAHPEFSTRPINPSPPYLGLIAAASKQLDQIMEQQKSYVPPHPPSHLVLSEGN